MSGLWGKLNYHWIMIEGKEDLKVVATILDTSLRDSSNSSCPVKIIQEKGAWWTDNVNKLRKHTRRELRAPLRSNVPANWDSYREAQCQHKKAVRCAKLVAGEDSGNL